MESSASVNLVCIGTDGRPRQKGLRDILTEWLAFRTQTVTRRTRFRLTRSSTASTCWKAGWWST